MGILSWIFLHKRMFSQLLSFCWKSFHFLVKTCQKFSLLAKCQLSNWVSNPPGGKVVIIVVRITICHSQHIMMSTSHSQANNILLRTIRRVLLSFILKPDTVSKESYLMRTIFYWSISYCEGIFKFIGLIRSLSWINWNYTHIPTLHDSR